MFIKLKGAMIKEVMERLTVLYQMENTDTEIDFLKARWKFWSLIKYNN